MVTGRAITAYCSQLSYILFKKVMFFSRELETRIGSKSYSLFMPSFHTW